VVGSRLAFLDEFVGSGTVFGEKLVGAGSRGHASGFGWQGRECRHLSPT